MGVVYRARDDRVRREVALKVVSPELATDDRFLARLKREARAAARVSHENVARIHDVGQEGGLHFLVLELLPGGSLADRLRERGKIPWREAARLGAGIARGL